MHTFVQGGSMGAYSVIFLCNTGSPLINETW